MGRHALSVVETCPDCGGRVDTTFEATSSPTGLRYHESAKCEACDYALEDEGESLTDAARRAFVAVEGEWALYVLDFGPHKLDVMRVLRKHLETLPQDLALSDSEVAKGALVELESFESALLAAGAKVEKRPL